MPFTRTITEGDMDVRSEEFVHDVSHDAPAQDVEFEGDGMEESVGTTIFGLLDD